MKLPCICDLRTNCIIGGFLLMIYFWAVSFLMIYEIQNSERVVHKSPEGELSYIKHTTGFWVLGTCFIIMALDFVLLIFGTIMRKVPLIILFLICQLAPMSVELFYLLVALMFGLETEFIFIYLLPFLYVIYVDVASCLYFKELRKQQRRLTDPLDIEY